MGKISIVTARNVAPMPIATPITLVNGEYVAEDGTTTNQVENFFRHLKNSISGTHISVSPKYLESYVKEFEYRFNRRTNPEVMLGELLSRFPELDA